jgi:hypothetical protein
MPADEVTSPHPVSLPHRDILNSADFAIVSEKESTNALDVREVRTLDFRYLQGSPRQASKAKYEIGAVK